MSKVEAHRAFLEESELKNLAKTLSVPTNDADVRAALRFFKVPEELAGEDRADRRERLGVHMAQLARAGKSVDLSALADAAEESEDDEEYYTNGSPDLLRARKDILVYSLSRCKTRLEDQRRVFEALTNDPAYVEKVLRARRAKDEALRQMVPVGTQSGFSRPVSALEFGPGGSLAMADWSGAVQLLDPNTLGCLASSCEHERHSGQVSGLSWSPDGGLLATGGLEGDVVIRSGTDLHTRAVFKGHEGRVAGVDYHPSGKYLASGSFDRTWRLWDTETGSALLTQDGHSREVYSVRIHPDGSLLASAGKDALARIWDLRSGNCIMVLDKHAREIYAADWSPNGYSLATGGADNSIYVWDLRKPGTASMIPAHTSVVSDIKFADSGSTLVSSSYDKSVKCWSADTWVLQATIATADRVLAVSKTESRLAIGRWDRAVDLWTVSR